MNELFIRPGDDLEACFAAAPEYTIVHIAAGVYRQKFTIRTRGLTLLGEGPDKTVFVWDDYARKLHADGQEYNTFRTWTAAVCADDVTMKRLSIVNDALHPETKGQEVALSVYGDRFVMEDCVLSSTQDTLFAGPLPHDLVLRYDGFLPEELCHDRILSQHFLRCRIEGTVDFIFGCGNALFEDCEIRSLKDARDIGFAAAPAHPQAETRGFTFRRCRFTAEEGVKGIWLARPWRDYGLARFENCAYGPHIAPGGFDKWEGTDRDRTARFCETPPVPGRVSWCNRFSSGSC